jgi:SNF2 family DNA or RNA helicase
MQNQAPWRPAHGDYKCHVSAVQAAALAEAQRELESSERASAYSSAMSIIDGSIERANKFHLIMTAYAQDALKATDMSTQSALFSGGTLRDYQLEGAWAAVQQTSFREACGSDTTWKLSAVTGLVLTAVSHRNSLTAPLPPPHVDGTGVLSRALCVSVRLHAAGMRWLVSKFFTSESGIVADEMGLGKTVQVRTVAAQHASTVPASKLLDALAR